MLVRAAWVLLMIAASACEVGVVENVGGPGGGTPSPDAGAGGPGGGGGGGGGDGDGAGGGADGGVSAADSCEVDVEALPTGNHNAGAVCRNCHDGTPAPNWVAAGTIYRADGITPLPGATIEITDANDAVVTLVSARNGNFWTEEALAFPLTVRASRCDAEAEMPTLVQQVGGGVSCNQAGCHAAGTRITLP